MARHKFHEPLEASEPLLDISSLIDVCFLLLIYFLVTSTITPRENDLDLGLASGVPPKDKLPEIDSLVIQVDAAGTIHTGMNAGMQTLDSDVSIRALPLLRSQLDLYASAAKASGSIPMVRLNADNESSQQRVIDVLDTLALVGIRNVAFEDFAPGSR